MPGTTILRARVAHTPRDPFTAGDALETFDDGAVAFEDGVIVATGEAEDVLAQHPEAQVHDRRDCVLIPGMVDTHVHYPQIPVIGAMGLELLEWLALRTLPEEAKMADLGHATRSRRTTPWRRSTTARWRSRTGRSSRPVRRARCSPRIPARRSAITATAC